MKNICYLLLVLFISVRLVAQSSALVKEEATMKVLSFLQLIPEGKEKAYGINGRSDFSKIHIEDPYQTYYITYKDNKLIFISGNEWRVPLSVNGNYVALLTVQMNKGKAEAVDFGGSLLAGKMQEFEKLYSNHTGSRVIIRNTFLKADYLTTDFSSQCNQNAIDLEVNAGSSTPVYELNAGLPIRNGLDVFCSETMNAIRTARE